MLSTMIAALVFGGLASFFIVSNRLVRNAFAEAELSVRTREIREKLLFHVLPPSGGKVWPGLLSASPSRSDGNIVENGAKILAKVYGTGVADGKHYWGSTVVDAVGIASDTTARHNVQLVVRSENADGETLKWLGNDDDRSAERGNLGWLRTAPFGYLRDGWADDDKVLSHRLFFINISASMNGHSSNERIVVPVFGAVQVKNQSLSGSVFFD
jgi:hypothetical protein